VSRFYVPKSCIKGNTIAVDGEEAHHIIDVMRLKPSDEIVAFDGSGKEYAGRISGISGRSVLIEIIRTIAPRASAGVEITLIQAVPKKSKMDYIVEKSTELGVSSVVPVVTKRTIPDWDGDKRSLRARRWRKIAVEASKQCGRADIPSISEIEDLAAFLKMAKGFDLAMIATLDSGAGEAESLKKALRNFKGNRVAIAIGPEGDFTPDEVALCRESGFRPVTLGSRVLKSDTAGLAALAVLEYELGK
jgi:16S rRNA (uracil1498-N3)-methyltransferase